jgi:hypothetical protein
MSGPNTEEAGMPLTRREQRALDEIERGLCAEDPKLTHRLTKASLWLRLPIRRQLVYVGIWIGWALMIGGAASARGLISFGVVIACYGTILLVSCARIAIKRKGVGMPRRPH